VTLVARDANHLDAFIVGTNGKTYHTYWYAGLPGFWALTHGWEILGGLAPLRAPVAAVARDANHLDAFAVMGPGNVFTTWWNTTMPTWESSLNNGSWEDIGGGFPKPPPSVASYTFTLDSFQINNTRSWHLDTDYVSFTVQVGNAPAQTVTKAMGDVNNGTYDVGLTIGPLTVAANEPVIVNYLILNSGHQSQSDIDAELTKVANSLASAGAQAAASAIAAGAGALAGASFGTAVAPIIGTALGALAGWFVGEFAGWIFANCDGPVAAQQMPFTGDDLWRQTGGALPGTISIPASFSVDNPGTNSPSGCGSNSDYVVNWSIAQA
jgi:hypothetical protein